ncbi:MAG: hypothetical protein AAF253_11815 [Pseudomonadota bacterium]
MTIVRKLFGRDEVKWAPESPKLPDFSLSSIELKLLSGLVVCLVAGVGAIIL